MKREREKMEGSGLSEEKHTWFIIYSCVHGQPGDSVYAGTAAYQAPPSLRFPEADGRTSPAHAGGLPGETATPTRSCVSCDCSRCRYARLLPEPRGGLFYAFPSADPRARLAARAAGGGGRDGLSVLFSVSRRCRRESAYKLRHSHSILREGGDSPAGTKNELCVKITAITAGSRLDRQPAAASPLPYYPA